MTFFGTQAEAQPFVDQLVALGPTRWRNQSIPWHAASLAQSFDQGAVPCHKGVYNSHPSVGTKVTSAATYTDVLNKYIATMETRPWFTGIFVIQRYNNTATLAVPESKRGVYPGREIQALV